MMNSIPKGSLDYSTVSIIIPVHNGGESFRQCLSSVQSFAPPETEVVIVVDGGSDASWELAQASGAKVIQLPEAGGPARARNLGAKASQGDILFFIDADVTIGVNTVDRMMQTFEQNPTLAALIGSYDDAPGAPNFLSQYKNLFHHYTHQMGCEEASTFWGACGAIRRDVFLAMGGFDESYRYPSVEDIELGYRLKQAGYQIQLCKTVQVKHLKRWEPISLLRAEIFYRAIPWTELIWRDRQLVNDLNLTTSSRVSVLLTFGLVASLVAGLGWAWAWLIAGSLALWLFVLNYPVYHFFQQKRGIWFALRVVFWHWLYFFYGGVSFAIGTAQYYLFSKDKTRSQALSRV